MVWGMNASRTRRLVLHLSQAVIAVSAMVLFASVGCASKETSARHRETGSLDNVGFVIPDPYDRDQLDSLIDHLNREGRADEVFLHFDGLDVQLNFIGMKFAEIPGGSRRWVWYNGEIAGWSSISPDEEQFYYLHAPRPE